MVVPGKPSSYALPEECPQGLTEYVTSLDIFVCQIHYSADPAKRHSEWREAKRKGIPRRDWAREMEIDWTYQ